jgi:crossover junction endodeoxyribonuclease RuvC
MIITALDMSLTAAGWASTMIGSGVLVPPKGRDRGIPRLRWMREAVIDRVAGSELVVIEGYAFGAKGSAVINLGELGGVIRLALADAGKPYVEVPPACVKLFATGKGNAKKDEVLAAAIRKLSYTGHDHNEADALFLLAMATHVYGGSVFTDYQQRAVAKIQWPTLAKAAA